MRYPKKDPGTVFPLDYSLCKSILAFVLILLSTVINHQVSKATNGALSVPFEAKGLAKQIPLVNCNTLFGYHEFVWFDTGFEDFDIYSMGPLETLDN